MGNKQIIITPLDFISMREPLGGPYFEDPWGEQRLVPVLDGADGPRVEPELSADRDREDPPLAPLGHIVDREEPACQGWQPRLGGCEINGRSGRAS